MRRPGEGGGGRRVLVSGLGLVSPLGIGVEESWARLLAGDCALGNSPPSSRAIPVPPRAATLSELAGDLEASTGAPSLRRVSNLSRYAVAAASEAFLGPGGGRPAGAGGEVDGRSASDRDDTCVLLGSAYGSSQYHFEFYERLARGGIREASPLLFSESVMNAAPGHVSLQLKLRGASLALVGGEEVGLTAVAEGARRVRLGEGRVVLAGGADEYCDFVHAALGRLGLVSAEMGRPYSGDGPASFYSEGAAMLLLEEEGSLPPDATPLAEVAGWGMSRAVEGGPRGARRGARAVELAAREALEGSGIEAGAVDLVVASAGGGPGDAAEAEGLARALGGRDPRRPCPVVAVKAALGEGHAFSSGAQAVVAVKAIFERRVPPTPGDVRTPLLPDGFSIARAADARPLRSALAVSVNRRGAATAVLFRAI